MVKLFLLFRAVVECVSGDAYNHKHFQPLLPASVALLPGIFSTKCHENAKRTRKPPPVPKLRPITNNRVSTPTPMGCVDCFKRCCTCTRFTQGVSRAITYFCFLLTILSLSLVGWSAKCAPCNPPADNTTYCHYVGLFQWCEARDGYQTCYNCECAWRTWVWSRLCRGIPP